MKQIIGEVMDTDVYTCPDTATLGDVVKMMVDLQVGGMPVVNEINHVVGFISDGDIMRAIAKQRTRSVFGGDSVMVVYDDATFEQKVAEFKQRNVMELAVKKVYCVTENQTIEEVARLLSEKKRYKKVPVVGQDGTLVGVARRATLVRYIFHVLFDLGDEDHLVTKDETLD